MYYQGFLPLKLINIQYLNECYFNNFLIVIVGGLNAKSNNWYTGDKTIYEAMTSPFGLQQIINKRTHNLEKSPYCIDLIFSPQSNLVIDSGMHFRFLLYCHHQVVLTKFNLKSTYHPPYKRQ